MRSGAYENKDDIVSKLCLTTMWYYRDLPHVSSFFFPREKSISREKSGTSRSDVSVPCTPGNAIMLLTTPHTQFPLYYMSRGRLREVKNKRQIQPFCSKSGRGP